MTARRALWRWSWRVLVRERRQQATVLALVALAVAAGSFVVLAAHHLGANSFARRGEATHEIHLSTDGDGPGADAGSGTSSGSSASGVSGAGTGTGRGPDVEFGADRATGGDLEASIEAVTAEFAAVDVTRTAWLDASWWPEPVELLEEPAEVQFGRRGQVEIVDGARPDQPGEVALTTVLAATAGVTIGDEVELGAERLTVTGIVEDPTVLDHQYAVLAPGEITADRATVLVQADDDAVFAAVDAVPGASVTLFARTDYAALLMLAYSVIAVAMLEVVLLAVAGFTVLGRRRIRQFGMLAATGATDRHVRQAMVGNGLAVGMVGGAIGAAVGMAAFVVARPGFEGLMGFRVGRAVDGWSVVVPLVVLATVACAVAAWWPARAIARVPVADALAARRPRPLPAGRTATAGLLGTSAGAVALTVGFNRDNAWLAVGGLLVAIVGVLLLAPVAVRLMGTVSTRLPIGPRIAGRDLARHQSRSAAALAALVLVLGIPTALAVTTASADAYGVGGETANLDHDMMIVEPSGLRTGSHWRLPPDLDLAPHGATADRLAEILGPGSVLVDIEVPIDPDVVTDTPGPADDDVRPLSSVPALRPVQGREGEYRSGQIWLATPELLKALGLAASLARSEADVLSYRSEAPELGFGPDVATVTHEQVDVPRLTAIPDDLITPAAVEQRAYEVRNVGWLVIAPGPLTPGQRSAITELTGDDPSVEVELPTGGPSSGGFRLVASIAGSLLALAILAVVVGLTRSEAAGELRSLAAIGASGLTRRTITAASAGLLSLAAALLAVPLGYLALLAMMSDRASAYPFVVPAASLSLLVAGVPLVATAAAWLLGGREPPADRSPLG